MMTPAKLPRRLSPEHRQLTVMYCDLVGSTMLTKQIDTEELAEIIVSYRETVHRCVTRFQGLVARYVGDGVLAYFGYPYAQEDAAERAIRASLAAIEAVRRSTTADGRVLHAHIGIATGSVVVGNLLSGHGVHENVGDYGAAAAELSAVGEAPNMAAHLQALAGPDTVVVAAATRRLAGRLFHYRFLGHVPVKGLDEPVPVWEVAGERTLLSRFHALHTVGRAPMAGRTRELKRLQELWETARGGLGQAVMLSGEPGIGKSRLTEAAVHKTLESAAMQLWYYCAPHSQSSALAPLVRQLTLAARIDAGDADHLKVEKIRSILPLPEDDDSDAALLLADLLSAGPAVEHPDVKTMSAQRRRRRLFETVLSLLTALTRHRPVVVVVEDLQWIDPSSQELIEQLIDHIQDLPVMMILTARPTIQVPWQGRTNFHRIPLQPLERSEGFDLLQNLLGGRVVSGTVMEQITERADGIPLYIEGLTRDVMESADAGAAGASQPPEPSGLEGLSVPFSLQDSLMSRLDRIGGKGKQVAQIASIFGRDFSYAMLAGITKMSHDDLRAAVDHLLSSGLIASQSARPAPSYTFRHVLIRDTAYSSLLKRERARLHGQAARMLRDEFPEVAQQQPELIAHHFERAGDIETAADFWLEAGRRSAKRSSFREAIDQLQHILALLGDQPRTPGITQREMSAYIALGGAQAGYRGFSASESGNAYRKALEVARDLNDTNEYFLALSGAGSYHITRAEFDTCHALADECLSRATQHGSALPVVIGRRLLGGTLFLTGELDAAVHHLEEAVALYDEHDLSLAQTEMMYVQDYKSTALCYLALAYTVTGYLDRGLRSALASLKHSRFLGDLHTTNFSLTYLAAVHHFRRDSPQTMERARESMQMALEQEFGTWVGVSRMIYGESLVREGLCDQGLSAIMAGAQEHGNMEARTYQPFGISLLVKALLRVARWDEAASALERAEAIIADSGEHWYLAELWRLKSSIALQRGDRVAAEDCLRRAIELARKQHARFWELRASIALGRLLVDDGDDALVRDIVKPVCEWFTEGLETEHLRTARTLLAGSGDKA